MRESCANSVERCKQAVPPLTEEKKTQKLNNRIITGTLWLDRRGSTESGEYDFR